MEGPYFAGLLVRRAVRHCLEQMKFAGDDIRWLEQKVFLGSYFYVEGKAAPEFAARFNQMLAQLAMT